MKNFQGAKNSNGLAVSSVVIDSELSYSAGR